MSEAPGAGPGAPDDGPPAGPSRPLTISRPERRRPTPRSSVFGRAAAAVPQDVQRGASPATVSARSRAVETAALQPGTSLALLVLPDHGPPGLDVRATADLLVARGASVVLLARGIPRTVARRGPGLSLVPLRADDALASEWAVLACGPGRRVAFLARRLDDSPSAGVQRWDWLVTRDAIAVQRAGTAILERVSMLGLRVPALDR